MSYRKPQGNHCRASSIYKLNSEIIQKNMLKVVFWALSGVDTKPTPKLQYNILCPWLPASIVLIAVVGVI